ncbi:GrpB family protein [Brevibacillus sp. NRS-1366]|uniref:GrpB family protein n=1 Tax=Brevibacillus sp. NRS-1366 TaxID=3233899 RepID=UPI003D1D91FA
MDDQWRISKHDPEWKNLFGDIASKLRTSLGHLAIRIDHVGSTYNINKGDFGRYDVRDREILRPFQYIDAYFQM